MDHQTDAASSAPAIVRPVGWGVCVPPQKVWQQGVWVAEQEIDMLQPACWHSYSQAPVCERPGFIPMVYSALLFDRDTVRNRLTQHPGETWLLFNEPERAEQAAMTPIEAIDITKEFLEMAWETGSAFQWAGPAIASGMADANGLDWLTKYVRDENGYSGMRLIGVSRPSYWSVHLYRSLSLARFRSSWSAWRTWYASWGAGAPVVISEVCAEGAPVSDQIAVMRECRTMLDRGDVAGVFWFSSHSSESSGWTTNALCSVDVAARTVRLTDLGREWKDLQ